MAVVSPKDLASRFAHACMGAGLLLAYRGEERPIFDCVQEFRGLKKEKFISWTKLIWHSVGNNQQPLLFRHLVDETVKCFKNKLSLNPEKIQELTSTCEKIESFLARNLKR